MDKNVKENVKVINNEKLTIDEKITIKELEDRIKSMKADKEKKCKAAKEQLVSMLDITVDKYRTATGTAEALRVLRFVVGTENINITWANKLALDLAVEVQKMRDKAEKLSYAKMDELCDGFYDKNFTMECTIGKEISDEKLAEDWYKLAYEMMRIDLCRNVGGSAEDMVEFIKRVQDEIDSCGKELKKLKAKEDQDVR